MKLSELVNTATPTGKIRCNSCKRTMAPNENNHSLIGVVPNYQFCPLAGKFATWTELAIPRNFIKIPNLNLERD